MNTRVLADRYELGRMLGSGGMAEVYEGWDRVLARRVAVKVLSGRYADDPSFLERFRREARAAASLNHPNIVGVFDTGTDNNVSFIVMELVEGRSLRDRLADGPLTPTQTIAVGIGVCSALAAAHANRLVHRDIKPGNIMLLPTGQVKVMDFGIARAIASEPITNNTANVLGTAQYLAPEQAQGGDIDARADIYALGCCVYEMLTGRVPFNGESPVAITYQQVREAPLPPRQIDPEIPPPLEAITLRAMAKRPDERFQTAEEMRSAFEQARSGQAVPIPQGAGAMQPTQGMAPVPRAAMAGNGPGAPVVAGAAGLGVGTGAGLANPAMANPAMASAGMGGPGGMVPAAGMAGGYAGSSAPTSIFGGPGGETLGSRAARSAAAAEEGSSVRNRLPVIMAVITVVLLLGTAGAAIKVLNPGAAPADTRPGIVAALDTPDPTDSSFEDDEDVPPTSSGGEETTTSRRTTTTSSVTTTTRRQTTTSSRRTTTTRRQTTTTADLVAVPQVEGRSLPAALAAIRNRGLNAVVTNPDAGGNVESQSPQSGTRVRRGSTVTLTLEGDPEPTTSTGDSD